MSFADHPYVKLNREMEPCADAEYRQLWPGCEIERLKGANGKPHELDRKFGIDLILHLANGLSFTVQEKFREYDKMSFGDYTVEYQNDPNTGEEGEWFHLCADLYFYGYANRQRRGWLRWYLLKVVEWKLAILDGRLHFKGPISNTPPKRANFKAVAWAEIDESWVVASFNPVTARRCPVEIQEEDIWASVFGEGALATTHGKRSNGRCP